MDENVSKGFKIGTRFQGSSSQRHHM